MRWWSSLALEVRWAVARRARPHFMFLEFCTRTPSCRASARKPTISRRWRRPRLLLDARLQRAPLRAWPYIIVQKLCTLMNSYRASALAPTISRTWMRPCQALESRLTGAVRRARPFRHVTGVLHSAEKESYPEDTESFDNLAEAQIRMARLVIEAGRSAAEILGALHGGMCPWCLSSRLRPREAPPLRRDGLEVLVCELCEDSIAHREAMVECLDC